MMILNPMIWLNENISSIVPKKLLKALKRFTPNFDNEILSSWS